jgi:hypothetical protein
LKFSDVIQSVNYSQHQILEDIVKLHVRGDTFEIDATFRTGAFYAQGLPVPRYCYDIDPKQPCVINCDCRELPHKDSSVASIVFDPPFTASGGTNGKIHHDYSSFDNIEELETMYRESLKEFYRVLMRQGVLVFKCQDFTHGRQQYFSHAHVYKWASDTGYSAVDLFIKLNKTALIPHNYTKQHTARKMHSYFWVFKKPGKPRGWEWKKEIATDATMMTTIAD